MSASNEVMSGEDVPAHDDIEAEAGDPNQDLPFFARLLFDYLRKIDGNGLKLDVMTKKCSFGKFYIFKLMKIFVSIGLLIFIRIFQRLKLMYKKYCAIWSLKT